MAMRKTIPRARQKGVGLIEALVSMVILSLCLLGMAALQGVSLRDSQSAQSRSMAAIMSHSIADAMRANITAARNGDYTLLSCPTSGAEVAFVNTLAASDLNAWSQSLKSAIGQTACGTINCNAGQCDVKIEWDDSRATAGNSSHALITRIQL